jgi:hypothetical protein
MSYSSIVYNDVNKASEHLEEHISSFIIDFRKNNKRIISSDVEQLLKDGLKYCGCNLFGINNSENKLVQIIIIVTRCLLFNSHKSETTTITISADPINENPNNLQPNHYGYECEHKRKRYKNYHVRLQEQPTYHRYIENKHTNTMILNEYTKNNIKYTLKQELTFVSE